MGNRIPVLSILLKLSTCLFGFIHYQQNNTSFYRDDLFPPDGLPLFLVAYYHQWYTTIAELGYCKLSSEAVNSLIKEIFRYD